MPATDGGKSRRYREFAERQTRGVKSDRTSGLCTGHVFCARCFLRNKAAQLPYGARAYRVFAVQKLADI